MEVVLKQDQIEPGNGLVPSGNKPLPEPILTQFHVTTTVDSMLK